MVQTILHLKLASSDDRDDSTVTLHTYIHTHIHTYIHLIIIDTKGQV